MWEALRWVACLVLGLPFGLFLICNWVFLLGAARTRKPGSLLFPFCCGPVCALTCWFSPSAILPTWFWIPLVLDCTLLVFLGIVFELGWLWMRGLLFRVYARY